ncbi:MAG TPA: hypothetical protein VJU78_18215, partial [Chitinophagaceae bacterium]|nr:hypothetical protein [Chitinophagaceae bacterium]
MKRFILFIIFCLPLLVSAQSGKLPVIKAPVFKRDTLSISRYGAIPDGNTLNTKAITNTIETLGKRGGGVVLVPAGLWLTGPLTLKNNINLHLAVGATLLFTKDKNEYPLVAANWEGIPQMRNQSPISATNANNIAI